VIAVLGGWLGVAAGVAVGWALVTMQGATYNEWGLRAVVPWFAVSATLVAVPVAAMALGWVTTRSRLPVARRVAS
jgi:putative ABC transport system permease protein